MKLIKSYIRIWGGITVDELEKMDLSVGFRCCVQCKNWVDKKLFQSINGKTLCPLCQEKEKNKDDDEIKEIHNWNGDAIYC